MPPRAPHRLAAPAGLALAALLASTAGSAPAPPSSAHDPAPRPALRLRAPEHGCPEIGGRFVALLDPSRGILLLSGASFPGGEAAGEAGGGPLRVAGGRAGDWQLAEVDADRPGTGVWSAGYGFRGDPVAGCVAFDKDRFSAEGDLVSYLHWLVGSVYAALPGQERARNPAFRLGDRQVALLVSRQGQGSIELRGKEGGTLACRFGDGDRTYLAIPFVLDEASQRVAVQVGATDEPYWGPGEKRMAAVVVTLPGVPAPVQELGVEVLVTAVASGPGP